MTTEHLKSFPDDRAVIKSIAESVEFVEHAENHPGSGSSRLYASKSKDYIREIALELLARDPKGFLKIYAELRNRLSGHAYSIQLLTRLWAPHVESAKA